MRNFLLMGHCSNGEFSRGILGWEFLHREFSRSEHGGWIFKKLSTWDLVSCFWDGYVGLGMS